MIISIFPLWRLRWNLEIYRFSKIVNCDTNLIFPILFKVLYISLRYTYIAHKKFWSKGIQLRGKQKNFLDIWIYFLNWKYFSDTRKNNPLLSNPKLKYLLYCKVFWAKVRRLQDQCRAIWKLVFHYFVLNMLQH